MLCKLHSVYNTLHTLCDITQKVSNHYTVEGQFFAFNLEKNYTGQKIFTQTPSVASVTNIGYEIEFSVFLKTWMLASGKIPLSSAASEKIIENTPI